MGEIEIKGNANEPNQSDKLGIRGTIIADADVFAFWILQPHI